MLFQSLVFVVDNLKLKFKCNQFEFFHILFILLFDVVDASQSGEGQLEISINEGEVPNHVQVVGGGRCLVSFTPEIAKPHYIDIKFNGETVDGCPFVCSIADTSRVSLNLANLGTCCALCIHLSTKQ